jgi:predicted nucleotidyltransferase
LAGRPNDDLVERQVKAVVAAIRAALGDNAQAIYLYGSAISGGLRPHSDLDLFVVVDRPTSDGERAELFEALTPLSAKRARPRAWRPVEVTAAARSTLNPLGNPPITDFQFGEWLRTRIDDGETKPEDPYNPDLAVLAAMVRQTGQPLHGAPPEELIAEVSETRIEQALHAVIPDLVKDLDSDTANVLLTLARVAYTLSTRTFTSKDGAADWALARVDQGARPALERARAAYLGEGPDEWDEVRVQVGLAAAELQRLSRNQGNGGSVR